MLSLVALSAAVLILAAKSQTLVQNANYIEKSRQLMLNLVVTRESTKELVFIANRLKPNNSDILQNREAYYRLTIQQAAGAISTLLQDMRNNLNYQSAAAIPKTIRLFNKN